MKKKLFLLFATIPMLALASCSNPGTDPGGGGEPEVTYLSVSEAISLANEVGEEGSEERQYVTGVVKSISNATYGEMYITDGTNDLYVYGVYSRDGILKYSELEEKPFSKDEVFLYGFVKTYNGKPVIATLVSSAALLASAILISS